MVKKSKLNRQISIKPRKTDCISINTPQISGTHGPVGDLKYSFDHMGKQLNAYAKTRIDETWGAYYVLWPTGYAEYLLWRLVDKTVQPMYSSTKAEDVFVKIDVFSLVKNLKRETPNAY